MKKSIRFYQFLGFVTTAVSGIVLHYLYDWTNQSIFIAPFSGINESTWEHMKLLFFPLLIFALVEQRFLKEYDNFWCVKLWGILVGLLSVPTMFYTYNGAFGKSPDWVNITIFFVAAAISFVFETRLFKNDTVCCVSQKIAFALICVIALSFVVFTFITPHIPLFQDPLTGLYGLGL